MIFQTWHWFNLLIIPGLLIGFTVHELGHTLAAYYLGDNSQVKEGKITANPIKHVSWLGGTLFLLFGIGWPKPVSFNPQNFKHRYLDSFLVAAAGPCANFLLCFVIFFSSILILGLLQSTQQIDPNLFSEIVFFNRGSDLTNLPFSEASKEISLWIIAFSNRIWVVNFVLAAISLIPLPPFDGFTATLSLIGMVREKRIDDLWRSEAEQTAPSSNQAPPASNKKRAMANLHFQAGADYHQTRQFDDAIARYRQAISADATYGPAYVNMGLVYKAKAQRAEAIQAFRAATRYASDEKSKNQAWAELHSLSALPGTRQEIIPKSENSGETPWTDTKPTPDWLAFWAGIFLLFFMFICLFGLLLITMIG